MKVFNGKQPAAVEVEAQRGKVEAELAALDGEIEAHQDAITRLVEAKKPLESARQLAGGRLARLHQDARAVGLGGELMALRADMDKARRAPIAS